MLYKKPTWKTEAVTEESGRIKMRRLFILALLLPLPATTLATQTIASTDNYDAVAYFTSGLIDGEPIDRIDTASLSQDYIVLYVDWENMGMRAYRTEVRIVDPNGQVVGKIRNTILPSTGRYYTYYYYRPAPMDTPGDWTYQMYVDGRNAFEARIPVFAAE
jgi:hypothetical protein